MTNCLAAQRPTWPCQRDQDVKASLSEALVRSRVLAERISVIRVNMVNSAIMSLNDIYSLLILFPVLFLLLV